MKDKIVVVIGDKNEPLSRVVMDVPEGVLQICAVKIKGCWQVSYVNPSRLVSA